MPEAWLRGPVEGVPAPLMPVAHSLIDSLEELQDAAAGLDSDQLWMRPGGAASVGFHLRHVCGALERLLTYARGDRLTPEQLAAARSESEPGDPPATTKALLEAVRHAIEAAVEVVRATPLETLHEPRSVGRAGLPSDVLGLLFHAAEHTRRHAGQVIATAKILRGGVLTPGGKVRAACVETATRTWEDAGLRGLCGEGRFEAVVGALRTMPVEPDPRGP